MKRAILILMLLSAPVMGQESNHYADMATGTYAQFAFQEIKPPTKFIICGSGSTPLAEINLVTGEASYSADLATATKIFWDAIEREYRVRQPVKIEFKPDCNTGLCHDGTRWRLIFRGHVIW